MGEPVAEQREGCLRMFLAVVLGILSFYCWIAICSGLHTVLVSVHPVILGFVRWAGAGVLAALAAACTAPRWRFVIVPPLLITLCFVSVAVFTILTDADIPLEPGAGTGMLSGIAAGLLLMGIGVLWKRPIQKAAIVSIPSGGLLVVLLVSSGLGMSDFAAIRNDGFPTIEKLLRKEVLVKTEPVEWIVVKWEVSDDGKTFPWAYGEMPNEKIQIELPWRNPPRASDEAGWLEGVSVDGVTIQMCKPPSEALQAEGNAVVVKRWLKSLGVRPELADRLVLYPYEGASPGLGITSATAQRHGIEYDFDWHGSKWYGFEKRDFPLPNILIRCKGTYSASVR